MSTLERAGVKLITRGGDIGEGYGTGVKNALEHIYKNYISLN